MAATSPAMMLGMWCPSSHSSCAGLTRASTSLHLKKEDVDGRDEPGHDAARQSGHDAEFVAPLLLIRHARTWCGHPRLCISASKTWMAGTSPAMTLRVNPAMTLNGGERPSGGTKPLSQFCIARARNFCFSLLSISASCSSKPPSTAVCQVRRIDHRLSRNAFHSNVRKIPTASRRVASPRKVKSMTSNHLTAPRSVALSAILAMMIPAVAFATDLPLPMPTKAPPAPIVAPPYNWSGFYVGGHLGYLWGRTHVDDDGVTAERNARTDGIIGGVMAGYNWQINRAVFGIEGDFGWTNARGVGAEPTDPGGGTGGSSAGDDGSGTPTTTLVPVITHAPNHYDVRWTSHLRGRIGYAFDNWLVFAAGG